MQIVFAKQNCESKWFNLLRIENEKNKKTVYPVTGWRRQNEKNDEKETKSCVAKGKYSKAHGFIRDKSVLL